MYTQNKTRRRRSTDSNQRDPTMVGGAAHCAILIRLDGRGGVIGVGPIASYPGLSVFFNVARRKIGRPGRFS